MERPEVFENLDRLVEVELRPAGLPMGLMPGLYMKARGEGEPMTLRIARRLLAPEVKRVVMVTGVVFDAVPRGELDGPIGSAVLADALVRLGKSAAVMVPAELERVLRQVRSRLHASFEIVPDGSVDAGDFDAAVAVERLGRNRAGQHHTIFGAPLELDPVADDLFERMNAEGRLTIGFGDGGNEIGFGALYDETARGCPARRRLRLPVWRRPGDVDRRGDPLPGRGVELRRLCGRCRDGAARRPCGAPPACPDDR